MKDAFKTWVRALRVPFFTATIVPLVLGSVLAWHDFSVFSWPLFFAVLTGALLMHAGTNLSNDFFDHISGNDEANKNPTDFSGGSRVIQEKLIPAKHIFAAAAACFLAGISIGLYLNFLLPGNTVLLLGALGVFLGFFYTAPPLRLGYNGVGEAATGVGFGVLVVLGSYFVQAQSITLSAFFISIPMGILIALVLYINEFPDFEADRKVGKRTLVVLLGRKVSMIIYSILVLLVYLFVVAGVVYKLIPVPVLITLLSLPLAFLAVKNLLENYDKLDDLLLTNKATIGLHFLFGLLASVGYVINAVF